MTEESPLHSLRAEIDRIDEQILDLLNERVRLVLNIGQIKRDLKLRIFDPKRESSILQKLLRNHSGPLDSEAVRRIFERLIDECRRIESIPPPIGESR
ncbi:MAG: chorismate mutase [Planctomycetota bacterium]|nr:chorismate mutase [Planctomycetota bacterium]